MTRQVRTLLFTSLYPSSVRPGHGIFVETRLRNLLATGQVQTKVIAPVPWFFSTHPRYGRYAEFARTPRREIHHDIEVMHPRYLLPPRVGMSMAPLAMALGARPAVQRLLDEGFDFDVIDAHYYYPDGVAAALLGLYFKRPFTVTARGSDLNLLTRYAVPRRLMQWAARRAAASIGVSSALVDVLRGWGLDDSRLHVMRNGVDLKRFMPMPQIEMRQALGVSGDPVLIAVGNLVELKGHHLMIEAMVDLKRTYPEARLLIVGDGPDKHRLIEQARALGVLPQVSFIGTVDNQQLARWYSAADVLVLASSREGWANVLLEAMACGTPVLATDVGGCREVIAHPDAGSLIEHRDAHSIASSVRQMLARQPDRSRVRRYAEQFCWDATSRAQVSLFMRYVSTESETDDA